MLYPRYVCSAHGLNKACTKALAHSQPVDDQVSECICTIITLRMPPIAVKPYCAATWPPSSTLCP